MRTNFLLQREGSEPNAGRETWGAVRLFPKRCGAVASHRSL